MLRIHPVSQEIPNSREEFTKVLQDWAAAGHPVPPPGLYKGLMLRNYGKQYNLRIFVETGTYRGNMVSALRYDFDQLYTIELDQKLYDAAKKRFTDVLHVQLFQGDSGVELEKVLKLFKDPALFWLDAHYSAGETARGSVDTPILKELELVLAHSDRHVILIDDARCFGVERDYPTIQELSDYVQSKTNKFHFEVVHDLIRIFPKAKS
jgi:hypothetical protein